MNGKRSDQLQVKFIQSFAIGDTRRLKFVVEKAVAVPGVGAVDKAAIARQLANALVAQGKTDVTQAELEQLINAVVSTLLLSFL